MGRAHGRSAGCRIDWGTVVGLSERISRLFGKSATTSAAPAAGPARAETIHGVEASQTAAAQDHTRQRMEAELDAQRAKRAGTTA